LDVPKAIWRGWETKRNQFLTRLHEVKRDLPLWVGCGVRKEVGAIEGLWRAAFKYVDHKTYEEIIELRRMSDDEYLGHIVPSLDNCEQSGRVDHLRPLHLKGSFSGGEFLTGIWYHSSRPGLRGAFQVRVLSEDESAVGGWLMFSELRNKVITERWEWQRHCKRSSPVIGVYGITGAGKPHCAVNSSNDFRIGVFFRNRR
jgi:hypothetical protein